MSDDDRQFLIKVMQSDKIDKEIIKKYLSTTDKKIIKRYLSMTDKKKKYLLGIMNVLDENI